MEKKKDINQGKIFTRTSIQNTHTHTHTHTHTYTKPLKTQQLKENNPIRKWAKDTDRDFTEYDTQMTNRQMKEYAASHLQGNKCIVRP